MTNTLKASQCLLKGTDSIGNVCVSRHAYNDWQNAEISFEEAKFFRWDNYGPDYTRHKNARIYCYIPYQLACETGLIRHPKRYASVYDAKVCVVGSKTSPKVLKKIKELVGEKPKPIKKW